MAEATLGIGNYIEIRPQVKKKKKKTVICTTMIPQLKKSGIEPI